MVAPDTPSKTPKVRSKTNVASSPPQVTLSGLGRMRVAISKFVMLENLLLGRASVVLNFLVCCCFCMAEAKILAKVNLVVVVAVVVVVDCSTDAVDGDGT